VNNRKRDQSELELVISRVESSERGEPIMSESENMKIMQQMYADFGQGNIPGVLNAMAEDVVWKQPPSGPSPFAGIVRGREQLGKWFGQMDAVSEVEAFETQEFIAQGDKVVVLGKYNYRATATGRSWESDWVMVWVVKNGKIARGQIFEDTLAQATALSGASNKEVRT
jgi:ketosteroid isomerase-like protein